MTYTNMCHSTCCCCRCSHCMLQVLFWRNCMGWLSCIHRKMCYHPWYGRWEPLREDRALRDALARDPNSAWEPSRDNRALRDAFKGLDYCFACVARSMSVAPDSASCWDVSIQFTRHCSQDIDHHAKLLTKMLIHRIRWSSLVWQGIHSRTGIVTAHAASKDMQIIFSTETNSQCTFATRLIHQYQHKNSHVPGSVPAVKRSSVSCISLQLPCSATGENAVWESRASASPGAEKRLCYTETCWSVFWNQYLNMMAFCQCRWCR